MCEVLYDYVQISSRTVTTRKPHKCGSCLKDWPAAARMKVQVGLTEGQLGRTYACPVCCFALRQQDHGPLHFCWGHWWGDLYDQETGDDEVYEYIKARLAIGATPMPEDAQRIRDMACEAEGIE